MPMNENRFWWSGLSNVWKKELIENLLESKKYQGQKVTKVDILEFAEKSDAILNDIVNLQRIHVSEDVANNLAPLNFLNHIEDFQIEPPVYEDEIQVYDLNRYPKHLRSKVRFLEIKDTCLGDDLNVLRDFVNLEHLVYINCNLQSLEGIQKFTNLKRVDLSHNPITDLSPLKELPIQKLNICNTDVTDLTPLVNHKHIQWINVCELEIDVVQNCQLLSIENLELIAFTEENEVVKPNNKSNHDNRLKKDRTWWKSLPFKWKIKLISNLLDTEEYEGFGLDISSLHDLINYSDKHLSALMNMEQIKLPAEILYDVSPLSQMKNVKELAVVFEENEEDCLANFLKNFPVQFRPKVKAILFDDVHISGDFEPFAKFSNLERLYIQDCGFTSLKGIEKLKNLTHLGGGSGNFFTDLKPLYNLKLEVLDLQDCPFDDISFIENMPTLEWLNLGTLSQIRSYQPLFKLPFIRLGISYEPIEITEANLQNQFDREILSNNDYYSAIIDLNPKKIPGKLLIKSSFVKN